MDDGIRVLHVIDRLVGGGAEASLSTFLEAAKQDPIVAHGVVTLDGSHPSIEVLQQLGLPSWTGAPSTAIGWRDRLVVRRAVRDFEPHLVHSSLFRSLVAASAARHGLAHLHTLTSTEYAGDAPGLRTRQRLGLQASHRVYGWLLRRRSLTIHAVSVSVERAAIDRFNLRADRFVTVPRGRPDLSGVNPSVSADVRCELRAGNADEILIMAVAREHPIKNHLAMLKVLQLLRDRQVPARLVIVGAPGAASDALDAHIEQHDLQAAVERLGHRDDVPSLLAAADVLLCTSHSEGMPGGVIEAMAAQVPVVAFRAPGVTDALSDDHPGLVDFGDVETMARLVVGLSVRGPRRDAAVQLGRQRYLHEYSVEQQVVRMHSLYRRLVGPTNSSTD